MKTSHAQRDRFGWNTRPIVAMLLTGWLMLWIGSGCRPALQDRPATTDADAQQVAPPADSEKTEEAWFASFILGERVGHERVATTPFFKNGQPLIRIEQSSRMTVKRFGESIELTVLVNSIETPDGQLVEFETRIPQGDTPMTTRGQVVGDRLNLEIETKGKTQTASIPWSALDGGFRAAEQSLEREPLEPGQKRTVRALLAGFNIVADNQLTAQDYEPVELLGGTYDLLRIDTMTYITDEQTLSGNLWTDRTGKVLKSRIDAMEMTSYRVTRDEALQQPAETVQLDLGLDVAVRVDEELATPHETTRVRYRMQLEDGDPAGVFVSGLSQQVTSLDPHAVEVIVHAVRPERTTGNPNAPEDRPSDGDRVPNGLIQSDDPRIVAEAAKIAPGEADPWKIAVALERHVGDLLSESGYSQAFASAAEVIESGEGDCTEHAVLLAALARARDIPARVATGLVYQNRAFYYHMWTEVFVNDRWVGLDATLGRGGLGAGHLKMAQSDLAGVSPLSTFLPVLRVIGRLEIKIEEID